MADAELDLDADGDTDTELSDEGDDLAARAQSILADLADLLTTAGIETTVTDTDDMEDAADDMEDAADDMMDAADDLEEGHKEAPGADMRKGAEKRGAEATLDKGEDHDDAYIKEEDAVDALVAEITSKVISRLNK